MSLTLKVLSYKGLPLINELVAEFGVQGGSIGRKEGNALVLPDSENIVSGRHAEIVFQNGGFVFKDKSTNGSFLVNTGIGLNNSEAVLTTGEIIRIGEYEMLVTILDEQPQVFDFGFDSPLSAPVPHFESDPFASPAGLLDVNPVFSHQDPFDLGGLNKPLEPEFKDPIPSSVFHDSFAVPDVVAQAPATAAPGIEDFLKGLDALSADKPVLAPATTAMDAVAQFASPVPPGLPVDGLATFLDIPAMPNSQLEVPVFQPQPAVTQPIMPVSQPAPQANNNDAELIKMFLLGAGIRDQAFLADEHLPQLMQNMGSVFRHLVEGLMDVLRARAEMKSQFRVSVTTIRSVDNNPLKFDPDVESVLKLMIAPKNPAFIEPNVAVKEAFRDIKFHQMAMTAGIQASLAEILYRFDPISFDKILGEGLVFQKKARCWELYCEKYPELKALAVDEFFGDQFAEAYEKQMRLFGQH